MKLMWVVRQSVRAPARSWQRLSAALVLGLLATLAGVQANEPAARQAAGKSWRELEDRLTTSTRQAPGLADLRRDASTLLAAPAPDWFLVQQLDTFFAEAAERLEDPRVDQFRYDWNHWLRQLPVPSVDLLAASARSVSTRQTPLSTDEVESLWRRFRDDLLRFESRLQRLSNDQGWSTYLQLAQLKTAVRDLDTLRTQWESVDSLPERWRLAAMSWPLAELQQAARSLELLSPKARIFADPRFAPEREAKLGRLAALLADQSHYQDGLPPGEVAAICHWLRQRDSDLSLVDAVERRFVFPNLVVRIPHSALPARLNRDLDETFPVNDVIVGTRVRGTGRLSGRLTSRFLPRVGQGVLELSLQGRTVASTVGSNRGATVASTGDTELRGTKLVLFDAGGVHPLPASVEADTQIAYDSVNTPNGRYGREVRSRVYGTRSQAERESARKAASYASSKLDDAVDPLASTLNRELQQRILLPLASRQTWPQTHDIRSDASDLTIALLQRLPGQFGAPRPPPPSAASKTAQILVHASFPDQLVTRLVQGKTLAGDDLLQGWQSPEPLGAEVAAAGGWSLTFAEADPVSVDFRDDFVHITVRLAGFRSDDRDYAGVELSVAYRLRLQADRLVMTRAEEFRIYPLGFASGKQRLSGPQLVTRQVLKRRLEAQVPAEFDLGDLLGQSQDAAGQLTGFSITEGWLSLDLTLAAR